MSMENCLQVSRVATARARVLNSHRPFPCRDKLHLPTLSRFRVSPPSSSALYSSSSRSFNRRNLGSRVACKAREATDTGAVQEVTDSSWNDLVMGSSALVLVDFWAPWCGPCRMIAPIVDELAKEYAGKIQCYKLNTDGSPQTPRDYGIRSIPTVLFFKNGQKKESIIGAVPKSTLTAAIDKYLDV